MSKHGKHDCITLVNKEDADRYQGGYVTVSDPNSKKVLCHGKDVVKIYKETERMGYKDPVVIYIPIQGEHLIYSVNIPHLIDVYA